MPASAANAELHEGVYMWFLGPELRDAGRNPRRALQTRRGPCRHVDGSGGDPRSPGGPALRRGLLVVTNFAAGLAGGDPSHDETQEYARLAAERFQRLLRAFIRAYRPPST